MCQKEEGVNMMPLTMAKTGEINSIKRIGGKDDVRRFRESDVVLVSENNGNVIVNIKESRVAISKEMANKILI